MHEGVNPLGRLVGSKGAGRKFFALQHPIEVDSGTELGFDGLAQRRGFGHEALGRVVSVVDRDSEFFKGFSGGGFSAADGSGEADVEHGVVGVRTRR